MTKLCNSCEYLRYCARSGIEEVGCDRYKRDTTTNEEWLCSLSTEEKATFLINATMFYDCGETLPFIGALRKASESDFKPYKWLHKDVVKWLKEIHNER